MPADQVFRQKGSVKRQRQKAVSKSSVKKQRQLVSEMAPTGGWHGDIRLQIIEMQRSFITNSIQLERNYLIASVQKEMHVFVESERQKAAPKGSVKKAASKSSAN